LNKKKMGTKTNDSATKSSAGRAGRGQQRSAGEEGTMVEEYDEVAGKGLRENFGSERL
jgi:hypothetical protein